MSCWLPETLYHYSPKKNRESILEYGLLGGRYHDGRWCIYLATNPDLWRGYIKDGDLWEISISSLNDQDFGCLDDEITYWGKVNGKIRILPKHLKRIE